MPVFIFEPDAFEKMVQVEGEPYREFRTKDKSDICSFEAFLEEWQNAIEANPEIRQLDSSMTVRWNGAIYGYGGYHRYVVRWNGEILFIRSMCTCFGRKSEPHVKLAKKVGFRIFPEDVLKDQKNRNKKRKIKH